MQRAVKDVVQLQRLYRRDIKSVWKFYKAGQVAIGQGHHTCRDKSCLPGAFCTCCRLRAPLSAANVATLPRTYMYMSYSWVARARTVEGRSGYSAAARSCAFTVRTDSIPTGLLQSAATCVRYAISWAFLVSVGPFLDDSSW